MTLALVDRLRVFAQQKASLMVADILREAADEIETLRSALGDATAFRSSAALNRARVLLGGPDMEKHDVRCRLYGDDRVECVPDCPS